MYDGQGRKYFYKARTTQSSWTTPAAAPPIFPALAAELSPEQKLVASAWKKIDQEYVDRTFAGQDWFTVHRVARQLGGQARGPRRRCYRVIAATSSLADRVARVARTDGGGR